MPVTIPNFNTTASISGATKVSQADEQLNLFMTDAKTYMEGSYSSIATQVQNDVSTSAIQAANSASEAANSAIAAANSASEASSILSNATAHIASTSNPHNVTKTQVGLGNVDNTSDSTKNVLSATKWTTARTLSLTGDATGISASFNGTGNISISTTLSNSGVTAGTYPKVTVDGKGRVTSGTTLVAADIPNLDWSKITSGKPTTLAGYNIGDAYTKTEVDSLLQGLKTKASVIVATTTNITLSGTQTIDDIPVTVGQRVLVKNQTTTSQNGIYICASGAWTRATDADTGAKLSNAYVFVEQGTTNQDTAWVIPTENITIDSTNITCVKFAGSGAYASVSHTHSAADIISGTLAVNVGGTGTTTSTGSGNVVLSNSPTLVTPNIGVATGTSFNSITGLSSTTPIIAGTAAIGVSTTTARADHVHPAQTTITGNAGTATALATGRTISITGDVTYTSGTFDGTANVTGTATLATITDSGTGTFKKITVDTKGRVTGTSAVTQSDITGLLGVGSITNTMIANTAVANLSGTNTGDETASTIKTKLGITTLSGSNTGDQTITLSGDVQGTGTGSFVTTLVNSGVAAGTYQSVTVDAKGRVTNGTSLAATDIPALDWSKITTGKPTTLSGYGISDATPSSHIGTTGASHGVATTSVNGFMSSTDKTKLDGIATNANNYVHPTSGVVAGTYTKITVDSNGHATAGSTPTTLAGYSIGDAYTKTESDTALALKTNKSDIDSVNMLRADKFLAAQNIANMIYTSGDLTKIRYNNDTDVNYEVLNYTSGNLSSINHYVNGVLKGTTTLSYSSENLVSVIFA